MPLADLVGSGLGLALTLMALSYLIGDNPLYRIAVHLFVGVTAGYAAVIAYYNVILPKLIAPLSPLNLSQPDTLIALLALLPALFLLLKPLRIASRVGSLVVAFLVGVGAAVAIGGAVTGTLFPQTQATWLSLTPVNSSGSLDLERSLEAVIIVIGTLATLGFFYYGGRGQPGGPVERPALVKPIAFVGQLFIGAAFGVMYAGALVASLSFFSKSIADLVTFMGPFIASR